MTWIQGHALSLPHAPHENHFGEELARGIVLPRDFPVEHQKLLQRGKSAMKSTRGEHRQPAGRRHSVGRGAAASRRNAAHLERVILDRDAEPDHRHERPRHVLPAQEQEDGLFQARNLARHLGRF